MLFRDLSQRVMMTTTLFLTSVRDQNFKHYPQKCASTSAAIILIILDLVSALDSPLWKHTQTHIHKQAHTWFNPSLNCMQPERADISVLVSRGAQRAVRGIAPMPSQRWGGNRQRDRHAGRQAGRQKVAIWVDRPQGHMVKSHTGWCSAAMCLCFQPPNLMSLHWNSCGWELMEFWAELFNLYSFCLIWTCLNKCTFSCLSNFGFSFHRLCFSLINSSASLSTQILHCNLITKLYWYIICHPELGLKIFLCKS